MTKTKKKTKPKKKSSGSKKKKSQSLAPYILIALVCVVAIWLILQPVRPDEGKQDESQITAKSPKTDAKKKSDKTMPQDKAKAQEQTASKSKSTIEADLEPSILATLAEFGVDSSLYKKQKRGKTTTFQVPLNKNIYDLYYANMVIKGRMEKAGAKLTEAVETGKKQSLSFGLPNVDQIWKLEIYLDANAYKDKTENKTLAIVVDDFGEIGASLLEGFLSLPKEVTFAIFPGVKNSIYTMEQAHAQGRESIIHVPMEPIGYPQVNPGKDAIFVHMKEQEIRSILKKHLDQMHLCIGINNHMGSFATTDKTVMQTVMQVLKERNKLFLDSRTSNVSVAFSEAQKAHLDAFRNQIFLDSPNISDATMDTKIKQLQSMSEKTPHLIAITHCHNHDKLLYLQKFIQKITKAGFTLVPLSKSGRYDIPQII